MEGATEKKTSFNPLGTSRRYAERVTDVCIRMIFAKWEFVIFNQRKAFVIKNPQGLFSDIYFYHSPTTEFFDITYLTLNYPPHNIS